MLGPHDAARAALDRVVVNGVQRTLSGVGKADLVLITFTQNTAKALTVSMLLKVDKRVRVKHQTPEGGEIATTAGMTDHCEEVPYEFPDSGRRSWMAL